MLECYTATREAYLETKKLLNVITNSFDQYPSLTSPTNKECRLRSKGFLKFGLRIPAYKQSNDIEIEGRLNHMSSANSGFELCL